MGRCAQSDLSSSSDVSRPSRVTKYDVDDWESQTYDSDSEYDPEKASHDELDLEDGMIWFNYYAGMVAIVLGLALALLVMFVLLEDCYISEVTTNGFEASCSTSPYSSTSLGTRAATTGFEASCSTSPYSSR